MESSNVSIPAFDQAIEKIEQFYRLHPTGMGWRFAYGPKSSLISDFPVWLIGINPGGSGPDKAEPSREDGNGYRLERWSDHGTANPLQTNVLRLFQMLGKSLEEPWEQLLDQCFTTNACPFRTSSVVHLKKILPTWQEISNRLWKPLLLRHRPHVIICIGEIPHRVMHDALTANGIHRVSRSQHPTGWGKYMWYEEHYRADEQKLALIRVPHLSRFTIFTREKCLPYTTAIPAVIAKILNESNPEVI